MDVENSPLGAMVSAARAGGKILREYFRSEKLRTRTKSNWADLVTDADVGAQAAILEILEAKLPGTPVIGEEKENAPAAEEAIYVDPLDGTLNYVHGLSQFAVSVGYWVKGSPRAGVVYNPIAEELYSASSGQGAFCNGKPLRASQNRSLRQCFAATGWPYDREQIPKALRSLERVLTPVQEVRVLGSSALALCYIASGILDVYWEWGLSPWDVAAGIVIAGEAGARITSPEGGPFKLESGAVLATNGHIHDDVLKHMWAGQQ
ncbi:MAG TPA: inositol monophosphatase family protein [Thermodesulfobacteriota bacterium]|nr:inositol monophosphatase family protein [Thermodesulfobacteriota bacterium]